MTLTKTILLFAAFSLFAAQLERGCAMDPNGARVRPPRCRAMTARDSIRTDRTLPPMTVRTWIRMGERTIHETLIQGREPSRPFVFCHSCQRSPIDACRTRHERVNAIALPAAATDRDGWNPNG